MSLKERCAFVIAESNERKLEDRSVKGGVGELDRITSKGIQDRISKNSAHRKAEGLTRKIRRMVAELSHKDKISNLLT